MEQFLVTVLRTPTQVPPGRTELPPGDPNIVRAVNEVLLPWITDLGPDEVRQHPDGDVAVRFGPPGDDGLLLQTYVVSQHANRMDESRAGKVIDGEEIGLSGACALGQGASQIKGPMASVVAAVRARAARLVRPVWLAVNTEGSSSHGGSRRIIGDLHVRAGSGIVALGTDLRVSLGNRGRADIEVMVRGESCHSSQPWLGRNPIDAVPEVLRRLGSVDLPSDHPVLGSATATAYRLASFPVAPHTVPEEVRLVVDRRLLPGEHPEQAIEDVRARLQTVGSLDIAVTAGTFMLPAMVDDDEPIVRALCEGIEAATGASAETFYSLNAFDAGYACSKGIPTPMFGPGRRSFSGPGLLGMDAVRLDDCLTAATTITHVINRLCADGGKPRRAPASLEEVDQGANGPDSSVTTGRGASGTSSKE